MRVPNSAEMKVATDAKKVEKMAAWRVLMRVLKMAVKWAARKVA